MSDSLDPEEVGRSLSEWTGEILGRFALDEKSVSYGDLYEAVACSWISLQETSEGVLNPHNHRIVDLFLTP